MRNAFAQALLEAGRSDPRVVLLMGDIGNRLFDPFAEACGARFLNCGIAEANMIGVAAGLALSGLRPVVYTIAPFATARCLEQIRVDLCYHEAPVVVVGVGAGLGYASLGPTHHACEDLAQLRTLPGMTVVCPGDAFEVRAALRAALAWPGPVYLRLGKKGEPLVHAREPELEIGRALVLRAGHEVCLLATGSILPVALEAGARLEAAGISTEVVSFHTVKPLDEACLARAFRKFRVVVSLEEHSRLGGLGGAIAEWLGDQGPRPARLLRIGTPDAFHGEGGSQAHARACAGLDAESIAARTCALVGRLRNREEEHADAGRDPRRDRQAPGARGARDPAARAGAGAGGDRL
jgi:transketolase